MDNIFFLSCFLPLTLVAHTVAPGTKIKNAVLLIFSLMFYSFGSLSSLTLLIVVALANYLLGLGLKGGKYLKNSSFRKVALIAGLVLDLGFLGFFKYADFLLSGILGLPALQTGLAVPLGVLFL